MSVTACSLKWSLEFTVDFKPRCYSFTSKRELPICSCLLSKIRKSNPRRGLTPNESSNGLYSQSAHWRNQSTILPQLHHSYNAPRCSSVTSATTQLTSRGDSQQQICSLFILSLNFSPQYSSQHYLRYALFHFFVNKKLLNFYTRNFKLLCLSTGQKPKPLNLRIDR
jgi:hypothetical protein